MTATAPPPVANRIAKHFTPALPQTPEDREQVWADTLAAAMLFFQRQLTSPLLNEAAEAARAIFDLEKTRLRHGRELAGTQPPPEPDVLPPLKPLFEVKACEQTLDAAMKTGAFGSTKAEKPAPIPAKTDEEVVTEFEAMVPEKFAWWMEIMREVLAKHGQPCDDANVRKETRRRLVGKLVASRAETPRGSSPVTGKGLDDRPGNADNSLSESLLSRP